MGAHVLLNSINKLRKSDKMQGLPKYISMNVRFYFSYGIKITPINPISGIKRYKILSLCTQHYYGRHPVMLLNL